MGNRRDELNISDDLPSETDAHYSVEEILAEFTGRPEETGEPTAESPAPSPVRLHVPVQTPPGLPETGEGKEPEPEPEPENDTEPDSGELDELRLPPITPEAVQEDDADTAYAGLRRLFRDADEYASQMYEAGFEEEEAAEEQEAEEDLLEQENWWLLRRFLQREPKPEPDVPPEEMAQEYTKGLKSLRIRSVFVLICVLALCYFAFADHFFLPLPSPVAGNALLSLQMMLCLHLAVILLGIDLIAVGMKQFFTLRAGMEALIALSCLASLVDGISLLLGMQRGDMLPFFAVSAAAVFFAMCGIRQKQLALRIVCKCAASSSTRYCVTGDPEKWSGQAAFTKHTGELAGFTASLHAPDCVRRIYSRLSPLLILAAGLFGVMSSVGRDRPLCFLWNFSAILAASASFSGFLCFAQPFLGLSKRLLHTGAALFGWPGIAATARIRCIVLTDDDLFPPGSAALNGIKVFGDYPVDKVVSCTASLIRASGSGLDKIFHDLLRAQGAVYRRVDALSYSDSGGLEAEIRGERILVGSAGFMDQMGIALTQGLHVKNAVFTAINGELAGIFAVSYTAQPNIRTSLHNLLRSHLRPVLATRNFSLTPNMLAQRFKLSMQNMDYPMVQRRRELSDTGQDHGEAVTAVICREGLPPFAEAVLGAARLRRAARVSGTVAGIGSVVGSLLSFYLTFSGAYFSLTPANLFVFMMLWMVPTLLISGWVTRF